MLIFKVNWIKRLSVHSAHQCMIFQNVMKICAYMHSQRSRLNQEYSLTLEPPLNSRETLLMLSAHMLRSENHTYSAPWETWVWPHEVGIV